jgi:hypothetical protein
VIAVRTMLCLHSLHLYLWRIVEEDDFRQVYEALLPTLGQLRKNVFRPDISRNVRVNDEVLEVQDWSWQEPLFMSPPRHHIQWVGKSLEQIQNLKLWPPPYIARQGVMEPPPQIPEHQDLPLRAVRERAENQLLRARLLYVRCYSRYANSFWVFNVVNRIGLIRLSYTQFINRLLDAGLHNDEEGADEVMKPPPHALHISDLIFHVSFCMMRLG